MAEPYSEKKEVTKKLLLIVNPISGKMKAKDELLEILQIFCRSHFQVTVHVTARAGDALRIVEKMAGDYEGIVVCGGDGTFNETVTGAHRTSYQGSIGFLPCGTTNDLARSLSLPFKLTDAARLVTKDEGKYLDIGLFNANRCFSYIAAFGAFTEVSYSTDQTLKNIFGHLAYIAEAARTIKNLRSYRIKVECDGVIYEDDFLFGAVTNSLSVGGVLKLKKSDVDLCDGYHEVLLVRNPKSMQDWENLSREILSGNFENKSALFFRGKKLNFISEEPINWCLDGEYAGSHQEAKIINLHQKVKVIYP